MLPHQFITGPIDSFSSSYVPSFPHYTSRASTPSPFIARSAERSKTIASNPTGRSMRNKSNGSQIASTPHSNEEQARSVVPLSLEQVLSKLKPLLSGVPSERKVSIKGVLADIVNLLRERSHNSEFNNLR